MNQFFYLLWWVLAIVTTGTTTCGKESKNLNIVLIMADDVGYECFSAYGSKEFSTPRLDTLAAKGIRFDHCHSTPLCTPSRVNPVSYTHLRAHETQ